jgi:hypothetical protein
MASADARAALKALFGRLIAPLLMRLKSIPMIDFYHYQFQANPTLLGGTIFVNYVLPFLLEALPWYFNTRLLSKRIRETRVTIEHKLIGKKPLVTSEIGQYVLCTMAYAFVQVAIDKLRRRVSLANKLLVKRLVMEKILFSEIGSLQVPNPTNPTNPPITLLIILTNPLIILIHPNPSNTPDHAASLHGTLRRGDSPGSARDARV